MVLRCKKLWFAAWQPRHLLVPFADKTSKLWFAAWQPRHLLVPFADKTSKKNFEY